MTSGRPAQICRADVVATACRIADETGLVNVSMRQIAQALEVTPMSLYRHVSGKSEILTEMVESVAGEYELTDLPEDPRTALLNLAGQQRELIARHPWLPTLASRYHPMGRATLAYVEALLGLFEGLGVSDALLVETAGLFNGLVTTLSVASSSPDRGTRPLDGLGELLATGDFPRFARLAGQSHLNVAENFERLVGRLLDGLGTTTTSAHTPPQLPH